MNLLLTMLISLVSIPVLLANESESFLTQIDTSFACNDLVQISLDENCEIYVNPDMILEGYDGDPEDFNVKVLDIVGDSIGMPITGNHIGDTLFIIVKHKVSGQSCWGKALIEDKLAPTITCSDYSFDCFKSPSGFPLPIVDDNCDGSPSRILLSQNIDDDDLCSIVTITRTYYAVDDSGNESAPCTQHITTTPPALPSFPVDTVWSCETYQSHQNITLPKRLTGSLFSTGSGVPNVSLGQYCPYSVVHSDLVFENECGMTFSILRTWTVLNWCTNEVVTIGNSGEDNVQLIDIEDTKAPSIIRSPFTVNANIGSGLNENCASTDFLLPATVSDNCHAITVRILSGVGEAIYIGSDGKNGGYIPSPGLPIGKHIVIYEATDECGNIDSLHVEVTVADQTAPIPVCDELTNVSLGIDGVAKINAAVFDDGSHDNCCLDYFLVSRMNPLCDPQDSIFGDSITICCADVGDTVQVVFRAVDCAGNTNDCMVLVEVEEKLPPVLLSCPSNEIIDCDFYINYLEIPLTNGEDSILNQFGLPVFKDNCNVEYLEKSITLDLDQCQQGKIIRRWRVTDSGENAILSCTQQIEIDHHSNWVITFPEDVVVQCGEDLPDTGEPIVFYETCELIAISYEDEVFTIVPDACFKIARTWTAINWCTIENGIVDILSEDPESVVNFDFNYDGIFSNRTFYNGVNQSNFNSQSSQYGAEQDGVVVYQQIIKVNDDVAPVVSCDPFLEVCISDPSCAVDVELPIPDVTDCGLFIDYSATGDLGVGLGPFSLVESGVYSMTYQVSDNCGNTGFCEIEIEVKDCKKPTPLCKNGLIIEMEEDSIVIVNPEIFDEGSYDNCPGEINLSFSSNPFDTLLILDCGTLGYQVVEIWVTDEAGNQDYCITNVFLEDNMGVCQGPPLIAGAITTVQNVPVSNVNVSINSDQINTLSNDDGEYLIEVPTGGDYSVTCSKPDDPLNGVTTYDIVIITKHILGVDVLDNPYEIIAADVNQSNSVTTSDLVAIRKLILQVTSSFPNQKSWKFIDKSHQFQNVSNPFLAPIPEVLGFNNLTQSTIDANFVAIKLGDVNFSADPQQ